MSAMSAPCMPRCRQHSDRVGAALVIPCTPGARPLGSRTLVRAKLWRPCVSCYTRRLLQGAGSATPFGRRTGRSQGHGAYREGRTHAHVHMSTGERRMLQATD